MPRSAGMRESGVRMVRENAMDGFFNTLFEHTENPCQENSRLSATARATGT